MIELLVCDEIIKGYKVVVPKNKNLRIASKYLKSVYTNPSQVKSRDRLKFIGWVYATQEERKLWKDYL